MTEKQMLDLLLRVAHEKDAKKLYGILRQINAEFAREAMQEREAELARSSRPALNKGMRREQHP